MKKTELEVGDVLWQYYDGHPTERKIVTRLTTTQACLGEHTRVKRSLREGYHGGGLVTDEIGGLQARWHLETDEIKESAALWESRKLLRRILDTIHWKRLPDDKVQPLIDAIKSTGIPIPE